MIQISSYSVQSAPYFRCWQLAFACMMIAWTHHMHQIAIVEWYIEGLHAANNICLQSARVSSPRGLRPWLLGYNHLTMYSQYGGWWQLLGHFVALAVLQEFYLSVVLRRSSFCCCSGPTCGDLVQAGIITHKLCLAVVSWPAGW